MVFEVEVVDVSRVDTNRELEIGDIGCYVFKIFHSLAECRLLLEHPMNDFITDMDCW